MLVRSEPRPEKTDGGIDLPAGMTAIERVQERAGTVVRKGTARDLSILPKNMRAHEAELRDRLDMMEIGDRVLFRGFIADANNLKKQYDITDEEGHDYSIIDVRDIIAVLGKEVKIGAFGSTNK